MSRGFSNFRPWSGQKWYPGNYFWTEREGLVDTKESFSCRANGRFRRAVFTRNVTWWGKVECCMSRTRALLHSCNAGGHMDKSLRYRHSRFLRHKPDSLVADCRWREQTADRLVQYAGHSWCTWATDSMSKVCNGACPHMSVWMGKSDLLNLFTVLHSLLSELVTRRTAPTRQMSRRRAGEARRRKRRPGGERTARNTGELNAQ